MLLKGVDVWREVKYQSITLIILSPNYFWLHILAKYIFYLCVYTGFHRLVQIIAEMDVCPPVLLILKTAAYHKDQVCTTGMLVSMTGIFVSPIDSVAHQLGLSQEGEEEKAGQSRRD